MRVTDIPMAVANRRAEDTAVAVDRAQTLVSRVVNTCFVEGAEAVSPGRDLRPGQTYDFEVQVGVPSKRWSNGKSNVALPEKELERVMSKEGLELRAVLFSQDFSIPEPEQPLILPPRPRESEPLRFRVTTPLKPGAVDLQLAVYYRYNLIQALRVRAQISNAGSRGPEVGNSAEVIFTLDRLEGIEDLSDRTVNLFAYQREEGTHTLSLAGTGLRFLTSLGTEKLSSALSTSRAFLKKMSQELYDKGGADAKTNEVPIESLETNLLKLAHRGRALHGALVGDADATPLDVLLRDHCQLQIANADSLEQAFPWSLIYDRPLRDTRTCVPTSRRSSRTVSRAWPTSKRWPASPLCALIARIRRSCVRRGSGAIAIRSNSPSRFRARRTRACAGRSAPGRTASCSWLPARTWIYCSSTVTTSGRFPPSS